MVLIAAVILRIFVWPVIQIILRFPTTTAEVMQANWSIRIPEGMDELTDYDEPPIFGDGPRYTVLQDEGYMDFFSSFHDGPSAAAERFCREVMDSLNVRRKSARIFPTITSGRSTPRTVLTGCSASMMKKKNDTTSLNPLIEKIPPALIKPAGFWLHQD